MADTVKFNATKAESQIIGKIADRALRELDSWDRVKIDWMMDVEACHSNGCPLRLDDLLAADRFNFIHDLAGIAKFLDRNTGKLTRNFSPRFHALTVAA